MGVEIERKFLVTNDAWRDLAEATYYCQGYLNHDKQRTVRVRVAGDKGFLTIKGVTQGARRAEFEYPIPCGDAKELLQLCADPLVEKNRRVIDHCSMRWEVDEFLGENAGLVVAEIELDSEDQAFELPDWIGEEVTENPRYYNANLSKCPFKSWQ